MSYAQRLRDLAARTGLDAFADELRAMADEMDAQPVGEPITDEQIDAAVDAWFDSAHKDGATFRTRMREAIVALRPAAQPAEQWETSPKDGEQWETSPMAAAQPVGEPVAVVDGGCLMFTCDEPLPEGTKLYTTPQPVAVPDRAPMTEEQVDAKCLTIQGHLLSRRDRDRAVWRLSEAHHGIKERT